MASQGVILISGVDGFIASCAASTFLKAGYSVRGTVERLQSAEEVKQALAEFGSRFEVVEIKDLAKPGAFDTAVKGCSAIFHVASPADLSKSAEDFMRDAVEGTQSILNSALEFGGPQLRSFVQLSTASTCTHPPPKNRLYTEQDWDEISEKDLERLSDQVNPFALYVTSKVAAEKAFWCFREEKKPNFSMTSLLPSLVVGPPVVVPEKPEDLNFNLKSWWIAFSGQDVPSSLTKVLVGKDVGDLDRVVDIRDLVRMAEFAIEHVDKADGQRFLVSGAVMHPQALLDILRAQYPDRQDLIKPGAPGEGYKPDYLEFDGRWGIDAGKAIRATGQGYIPFEKTVLDTAKVFERYLV